eukprot:TRINITY_DN26402_c0_g1_i1.p1 TRINITY_DN26402_c0_g1~~TRINITY_DN26402_c0_g1_i1.p1  ORF type:complete len:218 (+),score=71.41 TRINITY_DN26402_c0_g1_i1:73-726(+)
MCIRDSSDSCGLTLADEKVMDRYPDLFKDNIRGFKRIRLKTLVAIIKRDVELYVNVKDPFYLQWVNKMNVVLALNFDVEKGLDVTLSEGIMCASFVIGLMKELELSESVRAEVQKELKRFLKLKHEKIRKASDKPKESKQVRGLSLRLKADLFKEPTTSKERLFNATKEDTKVKIFNENVGGEREDKEEEMKADIPMNESKEPVSYTHLTLPTICSV